MDIHNEFIAQEKDLVFYAGKAILNKRHAFYDRNDNPWVFVDVAGFTFKIWEEREGGLLMIDWIYLTNLTYSGNEIVLNAPSTDTDIEIGKYYYEIEQVTSGGYSFLLAYGKAQFLW